MNSINVNKEKNQILKTFYGKHSIYFSDLKKKVFLSDKVPRFFILRQSACYISPPGVGVYCILERRYLEMITP